MIPYSMIRSSVSDFIKRFFLVSFAILRNKLTCFVIENICILTGAYLDTAKIVSLLMPLNGFQ